MCNVLARELDDCMLHAYSELRVDPASTRTIDYSSIVDRYIYIIMNSHINTPSRTQSTL